jgi:hypothetical protein
MIPITTDSKIYELPVWLDGGIWVQKWRFGDEITLDVFVLFSSLHIGFWPITNGVGTGFYPLQS